MQTKNNFILNQQKTIPINNNLIFNQNQDPNQRYIFVKSLGEGGFGIVSLYYDYISKKEVVIKKINKSSEEKEELRFYREINAMKNIKSPYSVEYYDYYSDNSYCYIIMEKCDEDLVKFIERYKSGIPDPIIKVILLQLNEAFKIMVSKNIIHRDLKPQNILIKYDSQNSFIVKLADFGLSREFNNKCFSTLAGTPLYVAPELCNAKCNYFPNKCDLWALGVIIYQLKFKDINFSFYQGIIPKRFDNYLLDDLVRKLIVVDPNKRINWNEYFNHPFFKN
jgi:serine/threonine protein kinase